jgi:ribose transport system ATP-binding protein
MSGSPATYNANGITKSFAGVQVLAGVDFTVRPGLIHGLLGHNGAGKSTLLKILAGAEQPDSGELKIGDRIVHLGSPHQALEQGIACVYQELRLIPDLTVAENIYLGRELRRTLFRDENAMDAYAAQLLAKYHLAIRPRTRVRDLSHPDKQMIEVVANLERNARFLFLDEPTTALEGGIASELLASVRRVCDRQSIGVVLVSHKLDEVLEVCDEVTVMSNGKVVLHDERKAITKNDIIGAIVGDARDHVATRTKIRVGKEAETALEVRGLRSSRLRNINLTARRGEVLGIYGLAGSGRTRFCRVLYGMEPILGGEVSLEGKSYTPDGPRQAMKAGVAFLTEERKRDGFIPLMSAMRNTVLPTLAKYRHLVLVDEGKAQRASRLVLERVKIRGDISAPIQTLSGGNQQKVLFGRVIEQGARLILLDEPTKGVDIGARAEIYDIIRSLAEDGRCVVVVSSEEEELLEVADRIIVFRQGTCDDPGVSAEEATVGGLRRAAWTG